VSLSRLALWAVLAGVLGFFATAATSYTRHLKKSLEVRRGLLSLKKSRDLISRGVDAVILRNPTERAVFHFFGQTLWRSTLHKMRFFNYLAVSSAFALIMLSTTQLLRSQMTTSNRTLLAIPLVFAFFLLLGIRSLANVPASLGANWVFQITERAPRRHYFSAFKKAVFLETLLPLFALMFILYSYLWGWKTALLHASYCLAASVLLTEVLFLRYPKIPFTCTFVPGKAKVHVYGLPYVIGFIVYTSFLSSYEKYLFSFPRYFPNYFVACVLLFALMRLYQHFSFYRRHPIVFHEEPEPVMISLEPSA